MCTTPSNWRSVLEPARLPARARRRGHRGRRHPRARAPRARLRRPACRALHRRRGRGEPCLRKVRASEPLVGQNLAATVSCEKPLRRGRRRPACEPCVRRRARRARVATAWSPTTAARKRSILQNLVRAGCDAHGRAVGHAGGRGARHGPRRRVPVQRSRRPRGRGGHLLAGGEAIGPGARVRHLPRAPDDLRRPPAPPSRSSSSATAAATTP